MSTALHEQLKQQLQDSPEAEAQGEETPRKEAGGSPLDAFRRASKEEVAAWYRSMSVLIRAGYPMPRALAMIGKSTSHAEA